MFTRSCATLAACVTVAACGGDATDRPEAQAKAKATSTPTDLHTPPPASRLPVDGGATTLRLDGATKRILDYAGVKVTGLGATTEAGGALRLPITGGELTAAPLAGRIEHDGGLRIRARGRHVDLTALRFDATTDVITAAVRGRRVPVLRVDVGPQREPLSAGHPVVLTGRAALIGDRIVSELGRDAGVAVLTEGLPLGTVEISARI